MNAIRSAVWVNEHAGFARGAKRWEHIARLNDPRLVHADIYRAHDKHDIDAWVSEHLRRGTTRFVAVGGDGTLHLLANSLVKMATAQQCDLDALALGAIGTGSSNDFHKPYSRRAEHRIGGHPCRLDFENARLSDLICIQHDDSPTLEYCVINASVGITAEANHYFNHPDRILGTLKALSSELAILYAALTTLFSYRAQRLHLAIGERPFEPCELTNLGLVKNRFFSGAFRYDEGAHADSGDVFVHLCDQMSLWRRLITLSALAVGRFQGRPRTQSLRAKTLSANASVPFAVELDGEVLRVNALRMSIARRCLRLCA